MSEAKHTPGPWETREVAHEATPYRNRCIYRMEIIAPQYLHGKRAYTRNICQITDYREWTDHPANARLIAAAPELLAALEMALPYVERAYECAFPEKDENARVLNDARAAIAKARGEA